MANNNKVVVKFLADVDGLKKGVNSIDKQLSGFNKSLKFFAGTFAAAFSAKAIIDFSKASVNAFSDFEEAAGKVGQVFQDQAGLVESWSQKHSYLHRSVLTSGVRSGRHLRQPLHRFWCRHPRGTGDEPYPHRVGG